MPFPAKQLSHLSARMARLASQLRDRPRIAVYFTAVARQLQQIEDALWDLLTRRSIDDGEGEQLNVIGRIVGQARLDVTDAEYRVRLKARILVLRSKGRPEDIYRIFRALLPGNELRYTPGYPAGYEFDLGVSVPAATATLAALFLAAATSAGVKANLRWAQGSEAATFTFSLSTFLTAGPSGGATTISVTSTAGFPDSGSVRIGAGLAADETKAYSAKTATTFTVSALSNAHVAGEDVQLSPGVGLGWGDSTNGAVGGTLAGAAGT